MAAILDNTRRGGAGRAVVDKKVTLGRGAGGKEGTPTGELFPVSLNPLTMTLNGDMSRIRCGPIEIKNCQVPEPKQIHVVLKLSNSRVKFFVMENETPKKSASASRENPKEECRFCKTKLVIRYGKTAYISTENIFAVSNRKEYDKPEFRGLENKTSSQLCAELGFSVAKSDKSSDRICKPCGRNLRSTYCFYKRLKSVEENDRANAEASDKKTAETERGANEGKCSDVPSRFKRQLPTTISPDRCAASKAAKRSSGAKKSLAFGQEKENFGNVDAHLNVEGLLDKPTTQVKTVIVYPNGNVECRSSFSQESASIIINISKRNWKTVANTIFKHEEIKAELLGSITKAVDGEFTDYCKDSRKSILLAKSPAEVGQFSNAKFLEECAVSCPFWTTSLKGANGVKRKSDETLKIANSMALSIAAAARARNHKMSPLAYRISTILFHSGTK